MRIAMLSSNFIRIPPEPEFVPKGRSGASEYIVDILTTELVKRGHDVTLFASGDSKTNVKLVSISPSASSQSSTTDIQFIKEQEDLLVKKAYSMAKEGKFDVIHSHIGTKSAVYADSVDTPTVVTLHSPLNGNEGEILSKYSKQQYYVSISDNQRKSLPGLNYIETVYHGIELTKVPFSRKGKDSIIFISRLVPNKGAHEAIQVAKKMNKKLVILGEPRDDSPEYLSYYEEKIKPFVDGKNIKIIGGFLGHDKLYRFLNDANCMLFPLNWEEPFGLVMVEAMACGTPVVTYDRGSAREVIKDKVTGYIVNPEKGIDGLTEAVQRIYSMPKEESEVMRCACRARVKEKFTVQKMAEGYERVYRNV